MFSGSCVQKQRNAQKRALGSQKCPALSSGERKLLNANSRPCIAMMSSRNSYLQGAASCDGSGSAVRMVTIVDVVPIVPKGGGHVREYRLHSAPVKFPTLDEGFVIICCRELGGAGNIRGNDPCCHFKLNAV